LRQLLTHIDNGFFIDAAEVDPELGAAAGLMQPAVA
jgi:hypothetical protein